MSRQVYAMAVNRPRQHRMWCIMLASKPCRFGEGRIIATVSDRTVARRLREAARLADGDQA